jgi:plasmid stability protein
MKTTLDLPDDLMREVKIRAAIQGKKLKDVMAETIRSGLFPGSNLPERPKPTITKHPDLGFPMVECGPHPPASRMTVEEILKLEQDALAADDLKRAGLAI